MFIKISVFRLFLRPAFGGPIVCIFFIRLFISFICSFLKLGSPGGVVRGLVRHFLLFISKIGRWAGEGGGRQAGFPPPGQSLCAGTGLCSLLGSPAASRLEQINLRRGFGASAPKPRRSLNESLILINTKYII